MGSEGENVLALLDRAMLPRENLKKLGLTLED